MRTVFGSTAAFLMLALGSLLVAGCGSDKTAADAVPALEQRLDAVDAALQSDDLPAAAEAVRRLIDEATKARDDGRLDDAVATDVIQAAERLLDEIEADAEPEQPTETTPDPPESDADQGSDDGADEQEEEDEEEKPDKDDDGD